MLSTPPKLHHQSENRVKAALVLARGSDSVFEHVVESKKQAACRHRELLIALVEKQGYLK